jgi:prepilin-type N-terminal cleavage/methylation domain-containing protein
MRAEPSRRRSGFTLIEIIMVLVIILTLTGISVPYFASTYRGVQLRTAARTINRMGRYARSMAIMREKTMTVVINHETMELYLGGAPTVNTNEADGELDQEVLDRLGYTDGDSSSAKTEIEKEVHRYLPEGLEVADFEQGEIDEDETYEDRYLIHYYPNGQSDWFTLELKDQRGMGVKLENDPISGKISSKFTQ